LDSLGNVYAKGRIWREEYFKRGLRDSIFRQYGHDGKIIYETTFKRGTGLWKEFHSNGKLYFEIYTKDGYFTDTLKLYNSKGRLQEKLLYKKDSLVYSQKFDTNIVDTLENSKKVRNTYKQRWIDSYNTPDWLYKKEFGNHVWTYNKNGEIVIKTRDTVEKGVKKNHKESIDGNHIIKTIQVVKLKDTLFESEKEYKNGKLIRNKYLVEPTKKNPYPLHIEGYDEQGNKSYISLGINKNKTKDGIYYLTKTDYYENKKITHRSEEILLDANFFDDGMVIDKREKSYYDLKNKIFKKEYIEHKSGTVHSGCSQGTYSHTYDDTKLIKTEYYEKGKLVRIEINKTP
jgi:hypothetical protein